MRLKSKPGMLALLLGALLLGYLGFRLYQLPRFMVHVDDFVPLAESIRQGRDPYRVMDTVELSQSYTYPPGQFFLSFPLARLSRDFHTSLFLYRLPSLLLWGAGVFLLYRYVRRLAVDAPGAALLALTLLLCSWRGYVESSQGYSYGSVLLVGAVSAWYLGSDWGHRKLAEGIPSALLAGAALGSLLWLSYQALFVLAAGFAVTGLIALVGRNWRLLRGELLAGLVVLALFTPVYLKCLKPVMTSFGKGIPGWATEGAPPSTGLLPVLGFLPRAWFHVSENCLTFLPWGTGTTVIAACFFAVIAAGSLVLARKWRQLPASIGIPLFFSVTVAAVFSAGALLRMFPLGVTRHTFALQPVLLVLLACALALLRCDRRITAVATILVAGLWCWKVPVLLDNTVNRVDFRVVSEEFLKVPGTRISDTPGGFSWEGTYLGLQYPDRLKDTRWFLNFRKSEEHAAWLLEAPAAILVSHRGPLQQSFREELVRRGAKVETLREIAPGFGTELSGNLNGGNGFYLYRITRS